MKRFLLLLALLFLLGVLAGLWWNHSRQKEVFLPQAENDQIFTVIGLETSDPSQPVSPSDPVQSEAEPLINSQQSASISVETVADPETYPIGSQEILLVVTNHSDSILTYSDWFDFRKVEGDTLVPMTPREGMMVNPDDPNAAKELQPGQTVRIQVPIDLFDAPLEAGLYRVSQLACFSDPKGQALACTEITATFTLE